MPRRLLLHFLHSIALGVLAVSAAWADDVLAAHAGSTPPLTEGFLASGGLTTSAPVIGDGGYDAWQIGGSGCCAYYYKPVDYTTGFTLGWRMSGRVRLVSGSGIAVLRLNTAGDRPEFSVTVQADGPDAIVRLHLSPLFYRVTGGANAWLLLELVYDPATSRASLLVDGVQRLTGYAGFSLAPGKLGLILAVDGVVANYNFARFSVNEDDVLADFESAGLEAWTLTGDPWTVGGTTVTVPNIEPVEGTRFARSGAPNVPPGQPLSEANVGSALSPAYTVTRAELSWLALGWSNPAYDGLSRFEILDQALNVKAVIPTPQSDAWTTVRINLLGLGLAPGATFRFRAVDLKADDHYAWMAFDRLSLGGEAVEPEVQLLSLTLKKSTVAGCKAIAAVVKLTAPAPAGGALITVTETLSAGTAPASVLIPAGSVSKPFKVKTVPVGESETGSVGVEYAGTTLTRAATLRPISVASIALSPSQVVGGQGTSGTVKLECKAGADGVLVALDSSLPAAMPAPVSLVIPEGAVSATFTVATSPVATTTKPKIRATANGLTKSKTITVTP